MIQNLPLQRNTSMKIKKRPWDNYKNNKEFVLADYNKVVKRIIELSYDDLRIAAYFAILLLTGSRVKEIIRYTYKGTYKKDLPPITKPSFRLKNIKLYYDNDLNEYWQFKTRVEKINSKKGADKISLDNRYKLLYKDNYKTMLQPIDENLIDYQLILIIHDFFKSIQAYASEELDIVGDTYYNPFKTDRLDEEIFPFTYKSVYHKLGKYTGVSPHNLRQLRFHFLKDFYHFDVQDLFLVGGWKNPSTAMQYSASSRNRIHLLMREKIRPKEEVNKLLKD
jgi:hypothetical protein